MRGRASITKAGTYSYWCTLMTASLMATQLTSQKNYCGLHWVQIGHCCLGFCSPCPRAWPLSSGPEWNSHATCRSVMQAGMKCQAGQRGDVTLLFCANAGAQYMLLRMLYWCHGTRQTSREETKGT